jgi:hypothetical protein
MHPAEQRRDHFRHRDASKRRVRWAAALSFAAVSLVLVGYAVAQAPPGGVNRPPAPVPAPGGAAAEPEPPAEQEEVVPQPEAIPAPAGQPVRRDDEPWIAWVGPKGAEASGGNAAILRDRDGRSYLVTTIDALGFRTGERTVELAAYSGGAVKLTRESRVQNVSAYDFRVLPSDDGLEELCVLRLKPDQARKLTGERTLVFEFDDTMNDPWAPKAEVASSCCHLSSGERGLERFMQEAPPAAAAGAPVFWTIPASGERVRRVLAGIARGPGDAPGALHAWHRLRSLLDESKTQFVDDARALDRYLRFPDNWVNRGDLATAFRWSVECKFPCVSHWRTVEIGSDGLEEYDYRPGKAGDAAKDEDRLVSVVSDRPGDDVTLEIGDEQSVGIERHPTPDAAVAIPRAGSAKGLRAKILVQPPPGETTVRVMVIETAPEGAAKRGRLPKTPGPR